jgi:hypothetical protein
MLAFGPEFLNLRNQALSQIGAFLSPILGSVSDMAIY